MGTWFIIIVSLCVAVLFKSLLNLIHPFSFSTKKLPPGPSIVPVIGNFIWLRKSFHEIELHLRKFRSKYGPIITVQIGSRPAIFIASHSLAHRALVQNGAVFSDRPKSIIDSIFNSNQHNITSSAYGPTWRLLRRNLTSEILHPSRVRSYSQARRWVLGVLVGRLLQGHASSFRVLDHFRHAMFCLLAIMCFGDGLDDEQINQIETVHLQYILSLPRFRILNFWPRIGKIVFRRRWQEMIQTEQGKEEEEESVVAYVDTLVDLELPEEKRKLEDGEMVSLCREFINAGTDTTSTALQWIMANLVKYPCIQAKLYEEITGVVGPPPHIRPGRDLAETEIIKEEDLQRMTYLKAVVLEGLRRHPPAHFLLPHAVTEDVEFEGYHVPKEATVNFMVADMGWDPKVWEEPMDFKPERFLTNTGAGAGGGGNSEQKHCDGGGGESTSSLFDITGSREIKMMPFGAGRRSCPGAGLALLHLEFFVANLVWHFEWTAEDGDEVDLTDKHEFTIVMKYPLRPTFPQGASSTES
ncbi:unnamed protein product, partial [Thlaspi arvense]